MPATGAIISRPLGTTTPILPKTTRDLPAAVGNLVRREYLQAYADQRPVLVKRRRRVRGVSIMIAKLILPLSSDGRAIDLLLAGSYPHP